MLLLVEDLYGSTNPLTIIIRRVVKFMLKRLKTAYSYAYTTVMTSENRLIMLKIKYMTTVLPFLLKFKASTN